MVVKVDGETPTAVGSSRPDSTAEAEASLLSNRWDTSVQTPHGGQEWRELKGYVEDFSVTTNHLGPPRAALLAASKSLNEILHYPPSDFQPAWSSLAAFLTLQPEPQTNQAKSLLAAVEKSPEKMKAAMLLMHRLLLGNGASELIDLVLRTSCAQGKLWRPGPFAVQYKEYARAAEALGRAEAPWDDKDAKLLCAVNPCNPTGDFLPLPAMKNHIEAHCLPGTVVVVDESMLPWFGPTWRQQSLLGASDWIEEKLEKENIQIYIIHSWTKLWACPGLRIGSIVAPSVATAALMRRMQVPWSLNSLAVSFLSEVVNDAKYMEDTWAQTPVNRARLVSRIATDRPQWKIHGQTWLPFVWVEVPTAACARWLVERARAFGVPIRWAAHGYQRPNFVRLAVRGQGPTDILLGALLDSSPPPDEAP
eukprot:GHVT01075588.1.p1 GENE.GHVT01075588.1~~GHVT01075588.1.p1  ORF type:complete len:421 (+),score=96.46 GHVT01075588.1:313-1575(+)